MCRDAQKHKELLKRFGFSPHKIRKLIQETEDVCRKR